MRIICPAAAAHIHPHVVLVDAPGVQDANAARGNVVKKLLEAANSGLWDQGLLLAKSFKANCQCMCQCRKWSCKWIVCQIVARMHHLQLHASFTPGCHERRDRVQHQTCCDRARGPGLPCAMRSMIVFK